VCKAQKQEVAKQVSTAMAAAALSSLVAFADVQPASADVAGLTPCSDSKAFAKLEKKEIKGLEKRLKKASCPACGWEELGDNDPRWRRARAA
jgi:photosystem I subunit III